MYNIINHLHFETGCYEYIHCIEMKSIENTSRWFDLFSILPISTCICFDSHKLRAIHTHIHVHV